MTTSSAKCSAHAMFSKGLNQGRDVSGDQAKSMPITMQHIGSESGMRFRGKLQPRRQQYDSAKNEESDDVGVQSSLRGRNEGPAAFQMLR